MLEAAMRIELINIGFCGLARPISVGFRALFRLGVM